MVRITTQSNATTQGNTIPPRANVLPGTNKTGSHTDNMLFNINLSSLPNLPAGTYAGTVTLRAEAN